MKKMSLQDFLNKVGGKESDIVEYNREEALKAVERNGDALRYVKEQTPDVCLKAVERNGYALRYVKEQTPDVCLKAVESDGDALRYVKEQTPDVCLKAVESDGDALQYVKEQTPDVCLKAVERRYVKKSIFTLAAAVVLKVSKKDIELKFGCSVEIIEDGENG